jgi:Beta-propeller repeat
MKPISVARTSNQLMRFAGLLLMGACVFAATPTQVLPRQPIRFEPQVGRSAPANAPSSTVAWSAHGLGYSLAFTADATLFQLGEKTLALRLLGADPHANFEATTPYSVPTQYFTAAYRGSVQSYRRLRRHQVYPGVDVVYYGTGDNLEYDFEIAPGADPSRIRLRFDGADRLRMALDGDLLVELGGQTVTQHLPVVYQVADQVAADGKRTAVHAEYQIEANRDVTLRLDRYDPSAPLVIDPVITFAAYLPGSNNTVGVAIAHDAQGFIYLAGNTSAQDFVSTPNAFFGVNRGIQNAWLMKLNPFATSGDQVIVYSTYFGGSLVDSLKDMVVDPATGLVYLTGSTTSTDLLVTPGAFQTTLTGTTNAFVAVFDPTQPGSLLYATYLGGTGADVPYGIATHGGKAYVTGSTTSFDFPVANATFPQNAGGTDMFITELDPRLSGAASVIASAYFGGAGLDYGTSVAVDATGFVYVAGVTYSFDIPITGGAYQATANGGGEAFVVEFALEYPLILHSTYLGGSGTDGAKRIVIDPNGNVAIAGTTSSANFPITQSAYQSLLGGPHATPGGPNPSNAFLSILNLNTPVQSLVYSTFFGGSVDEVPYSLRLDANGTYYLGGFTLSPDLPVSQNAINGSSAKGGFDGFIALINPGKPALNSLLYSSYVTGPGSQIVYGVDFDASGTIYSTGFATGNIYPAGYQTYTAAPGIAEVFLYGVKP